MIIIAAGPGNKLFAESKVGDPGTPALQLQCTVTAVLPLKDIDLDLEHILDAGLSGDHCVQVWWRSDHLPARSDGQCKFSTSVHCIVTK